MTMTDPYEDLRGWIEQVKQMGQLQEATGADPHLEVGAIHHMVCRTPGAPAVLFSGLKGYPENHRLLFNLFVTPDRFALTLGLPAGLDNVGLVQAWRKKLSVLQPVPPTFVKGGPLLEGLAQVGDEVDLSQFPAPLWNSLDGGPYIGTADVVVTRDPDSGWINLGTYRVMVHDKQRLGLMMEPGRHGRAHLERYHAVGKPMPVAIVIGCDPLMFVCSSLGFPFGQSEYDIAGAVRGAPVNVVEAPLTGLPVPATAEVVIEGHIYPGDTQMEGPFGEWTGYYGSEASPQPVIRVERINYRPDPIMMASAPVRPPAAPHYARAVLKSGKIWNDMERAGVPGITGVWAHEVGGGNLFLVVAIKQAYAGHATQAGFMASQCRQGLVNGRYVVVVDDDINPADLENVMWAICTRSDPERSIQIIRRCHSTPLDTGKLPDAIFSSRAIIDATRPYESKDQYPPVIAIDPAYLDRIKEQWGWLVRG